MLCKCGCGQEMPEGYKQEYLYGHRRQAAQSTTMIPCMCGCGKTKKKFDKSGQLAPIYLKGHNPTSLEALPHGFGKHNPFYGHRHTEETKQAHSMFMKEWHEIHENPFKGKHHTEETKQVLSIINTGRNLPLRTEEHCQKLSEANQRNKEQNAESTRRLWQDSEYRNKVIAANTGRKRNSEAKANIARGRRAAGNKSGPEASNWQGGKSFDPYIPEFNSKLRRKVRKRDNHTCQLCGLSSAEQKQALDVHHWDYDKSKTDIYYFIALCHCCHSKTQGKHVRKIYTPLFRTMMEERFPEHG